MRSVLATSATILTLSVIIPSIAFAQTAATGPSASVPRVINVGGVFQPVDGQPPRAVETVTLVLYTDPTGGAPLWQETQSVAVDAKGHYALLLGATSADGIPAAVLAAGAQWLSTTFDRPGEVESPRVRLTSVPYTLRAADADTLGGRPASAYLLAPGATTATDGTATTAGQASANGLKPGAPAPDVIQPGTVGHLAKYVSPDDVGNSAVVESGGFLGIGTDTPLDSVHAKFTNTSGTLTGYAVQNLGNTTGSYSGMLFYDQNGILGQFQGFNNVTHEYRINNIAKNGASVVDGSINFMTGSKSRFLVTSAGNIGIGTTTPSALLEVSNAVPGGPANMWMTSYTNFVNPYYMARRSRGTFAAPTAVQSGDGLAGFYGEGYGTTAFGPGFAGGMTVQAAQNWTDTAHGTALTFTTTPFSSTASATRMTLDASGNLGIGTSFPTALLEISNGLTPASPASATIATYNAAPGGSFLTGRKARGTSAAPTAVQNGDGLLALSGRGYGTTHFGGGATIGMSATENYTDTAMGGRIQFFTTPNGTTNLLQRMTITDEGDVGVGTSTPAGSLEVVRSGDDAEIHATTYNAGLGNSAFVAETARGTAVAPAAVQLSDTLATFAGQGYATTHFSGWAGGMHVIAAENWTDAAMGTLLAFFTRPLGASSPNGASLAIMPDGSVGIGTFTQIPTIADKLQVFGDIRVGTSGTNGCINNFSGAGIIGTCSSDRRFKKNITPFGSVLTQLTALQPVHYFWRATEFPDRHFGDAQAYGLIAQDVERVLPELVVTNKDGYKAIDYSKLPLLTIQAVKELKAENDELKRRLAAIERVLAEMAAKSDRR
jgi:endosialidase-like protein